MRLQTIFLVFLIFLAHTTNIYATDVTQKIINIDNALFLSKNQDWIGLKVHCIEWTQSEPENVNAWYYLGKAYTYLGQTPDSIEAYHQLVKIDINDGEAWKLLGRAHEKQNQILEAIYAYDHVLRIKPDDDIWWNKLARAHEELGNTDEAIKAYEHVIRLRNDDYMSLMSLGGLYSIIGNVDKVIEIYKRLNILEPTFARFLVATAKNKFIDPVLAEDFLGRIEALQ